MSSPAFVPTLRHPYLRHVAQLLSGVLLVAPLLAMPSRASAQIAVVGNAVDEHEAGPGQRYVSSITVRNLTAEPQPVRIYQTDYRFSADGTSNFDSAGTVRRSNAAWIKPSASSVTIPPLADVVLNYAVTVPAIDSLRGTYWSAIMVALKGLRNSRVRMKMVGIHSTRCIHGAGWNSASVAKARIITMGATAKITNTAGPSPLSANFRSRPQLSQTGATLRKPENSRPSPQRGHRHAQPAAKGDTRLSFMSFLRSVRSRPETGRPLFRDLAQYSVVLRRSGSSRA